MRTATTPFVFVGCVELREALDEHALDLRELVERLAGAPAASVLFHTYGYFLRHRPYTVAWGNDFARWAAVEVGDRALGERLAVVDPFAFEGLEVLREELVSIVHDHIRGQGVLPRVPWDRAFHFQQSQVVPVPLGPWATTLAQFRDGLAGVDPSALYYHLVDTRARQGRRVSDFAEWLRDALEMPALAERFERVDLYLATLERVRGRLLALVDQTLEADRG
jgi:hypothetical protein